MQQMPDDPAALLFQEVSRARPDVYEEILRIIRPHSIAAVVRIFRDHLKRNVRDLSVFNEHRERIPRLILRFVRVLRKNLPTPGDAFGIHLTCRITKNDTQGTLDSKHLGRHRGSRGVATDEYNVERELRYQLNVFSSQTQVFEMAMRHKYATVYVRGYSVRELLDRIPDACFLEPGGPFNKAKSVGGTWRYLDSYSFILVQDPRNSNTIKIVYRSARDLNRLLRHLDSTRVLAFSDVRAVYKMCGIMCYFLNMCEIVRLRLFEGNGDDCWSAHERDMITVLKYQCRSGTPLAMNRNGLASNKERSPIEVISFEAPKKNYARLAFSQNEVCGVDTSADKIFFGQQFIEGTGYKFAIIPKEGREVLT